MQVDTQPFPVNIIELARKKVLIQPKMVDKGKGKNIVIGDPHTLNISQGGIARKTPDKKTNKSGGARGQAQTSSRAKLPDSSITDGPAPTRGRSGALTDGPADSAGQSTYGYRHRPPHSKKGNTGAKHI
jgi:hypothetical protein